MFGYIKPFKPELKIKDFEIYRSVYCGLCKELGRVYGPFSRLTLSYDFAFLALIELSLADSPPCMKKQMCVVHPFSKRMCCQSGKGFQLTAAAAMLLVHYKNLDNYHDSGFFGKLASLFLLPFTALAKRKAAKLYPELDIIIGNTIKKQTELESSHCSSVDMASDPTATALSKICEMFSKDENQRRVLARFGYLTGRWVYLMDALDDLEQDYKRSGYNPFILSHSLKSLDEESVASVKEEALASMNLTLGEITKAYQLLELKQYAPILENIIYIGLPNMQTIVKSPKRSNKNDRPL